ncbi:MAG: patatin-like phospholipase family protein [Candidatus Thorarchaeota archaeon]
MFEGGGVRGIAYVGIMRRLQEKGILSNIKNVGGSSAGSQMAALVALGFTVKEIEEIMIELPLESFQDNSCGCIRDICRFFNEFGYNKGEFMDNYFEDIIKQKTGIKKATFKQLYDKSNIHLKITGTCLETESLEIFDHISTPDMPVSLAIHISSCIPFFFKAVKYNGKTYVDGGCLKNFPLDLFVNDEGRTLAFDLVSDEKEREHKIKGMKDFTMGFVNMMLLAANRIDSINEKVDVVKINTGNVSAFDFDIDSNKIEYLLKAGYNAMQ